jgi:steroid delta-isomerase-like uncharacterized protein
MRDLVERFYAQAWNLLDDAAVAGLLDERFVFRGSLGDEVSGRDGFRAYRDKIRAAFPDFHNEILDLVTQGNRAAARLRYTGHRRREILGVPATGTLVTYHGAAFFTARDGRWLALTAEPPSMHGTRDWNGSSSASAAPAARPRGLRDSHNPR